MQEYMSQGHLYLSGGGNDDQSFPLDILFFKEIPTEGKFFYVPIALRGHRLYPGAADWMKGIVKKHGRDTRHNSDTSIFWQAEYRETVRLCPRSKSILLLALEMTGDRIPR